MRGGYATIIPGIGSHENPSTIKFFQKCIILAKRLESKVSEKLKFFGTG